MMTSKYFLNLGFINKRIGGYLKLEIFKLVENKN